MSKIKHIMGRAEAAKEAHKGKDMGKKGKNFNKIAEKASKEYGSKEDGNKVAGVVFQRLRRNGKL